MSFYLNIRVQLPNTNSPFALHLSIDPTISSNRRSILSQADTADQTKDTNLGTNQNLFYYLLQFVVNLYIVKMHIWVD